MNIDILDDMGVSKLSTKVVLKVNYSFKFYRQNETVYSRSVGCESHNWTL